MISMRKIHIPRRTPGLQQRPLRYNELKTAVLHVLTTEGWCDSNRIIDRTRSELGLSLSSRAVRMALLRYYRYGLLHREWRRGEYAYRLSDRGATRLLWLRGLATVESTSPVDSKLSSRLG
jgi:DNA-binding transcriptional ArsR family regulator